MKPLRNQALRKLGILVASVAATAIAAPAFAADGPLQVPTVVPVPTVMIPVPTVQVPTVVPVPTVQVPTVVPVTRCAAGADRRRTEAAGADRPPRRRRRRLVRRAAVPSPAARPAAALPVALGRRLDGGGWRLGADRAAVRPARAAARQLACLGVAAGGGSRRRASSGGSAPRASARRRSSAAAPPAPAAGRVAPARARLRETVARAQSCLDDLSRRPASACSSCARGSAPAPPRSRAARRPAAATSPCGASSGSSAASGLRRLRAACARPGRPRRHAPALTAGVLATTGGDAHRRPRGSGGGDFGGGDGPRENGDAGAGGGTGEVDSGDRGGVAGRVGHQPAAAPGRAAASTSRSH